MNWRWVKPLESEDLIKEYEENIGYTFPNEYKEVVKNYNGARPEFKEFKLNLPINKFQFLEELPYKQ